MKSTIRIPFTGRVDCDQVRMAMGLIVQHLAGTEGVPQCQIDCKTLCERLLEMTEIVIDEKIEIQRYR